MAESMRDRLWAALDDGMLDAKEIAQAFLKWCPDCELREFVRQNDIQIDEQENDDE